MRMLGWMVGLSLSEGRSNEWVGIDNIAEVV